MSSTHDAQNVWEKLQGTTGRDRDRRWSPQCVFATQARPCCWHRAIESLCILCKACGETSRPGNKRETLIKENLLILSSPGCRFTVALSWPNYSLLLKSIENKAWIFSSSLVLVLELVLHTLRRIQCFTGLRFNWNLFFPVLSLVKFLVGCVSSHLSQCLATTPIFKESWSHKWGRHQLHWERQKIPTHIATPCDSEQIPSATLKHFHPAQIAEVFYSQL